jgi:hypothetical protein
LSHLLLSERNYGLKKSTGGIKKKTTSTEIKRYYVTQSPEGLAKAHLDHCKQKEMLQFQAYLPAKLHFALP